MLLPKIFLLAFHIFLLLFEIFLLLPDHLLALLLIQCLLLLISRALLFQTLCFLLFALFLHRAALCLQRLTFRFLPTADHFLAVLHTSAGSAFHLLLHVAATGFMLGIFAAGIAASFTVGSFTLQIRAGASGALRYDLVFPALFRSRFD